MKKIKLYEEFMSDLVNEKKTTYDYGCAMIYFEFPEMESLHKQIDKEDVFVDPNDSTFGLETEPHCTLLYGLHADVAVNTIKKIVDGFDFGECTIEGASLFENEKFDVLKFDVTGSGLHDCNAALVKLPHTTDYPNYHPHMTIAYLKNGMGKKYVDLLGTEKRTLKPSYIVYSQPDGTKSKIDL
jgi:2'-5' RNA ligase